MNDEIKFDLDKDIIMQIEMASYTEYNDTLAMMNDHLGEIYGYSNLKDVEEAQLHYEKELAYKAIKELQQENERLKEQYKNSQITLTGEWKKRLEVEEKNKHLDNQITMLKQQNNAITEMGLDYKSRCEKAIEYTDKQKKKMYKSRNKIALFVLMKLENILQNGSDSQ